MMKVCFWVIMSAPLIHAGQADTLECQCCFCDVAASEATAMDCEHAFCNDCWRQHCLTQIADGRARKLLCMGVRCNAVCDEDKVWHIAGVRCMELGISLALWPACLV